MINNGICEGKMKYIIWDWNGTLFNDVDVCIEAMNQLLKKYKKPLIKDKENYRSLFSFPVQDYYERLGFDFNQTSFKILAKEYMTIYRNLNQTCRLTTGVKELLSKFRDMGFKQIILSVSSTEDLAKQSERFNIAFYFDKILGIENIYARTKTQIAKRWKESLPSNKKYDFFVIGDTLHDLDVAKEIGATCFLYTQGHQEIPLQNDNKYIPVENISSALDRINNKKKHIEQEYRVLEGGNMNKPPKER